MNIEEAKRSLPWYAAGTLSAQEAGAVEALLAESPELREDLKELHALIDAVNAQAATEPSFRPSMIDGAWRRIDAYERSRRSARSSGPAAQIARLWRGLQNSWLELSMTGRWAVAAQAAIILVLGAVVTAPHLHVGEGYRTLSGANTRATPASGPRFTVSFQPTATESQIRELLSTLGAQIVAGPTGEELYTVQLVNKADPDKVLEQLRASAATVRFASREGT